MARELLRQVKVASPCNVAWSEMQGDDRVRHCTHCKHNVFNLSEMSDKEAEALLRSTNGRLCVRYYQRTDGTVMTRNCPVGVAAIRRRFAIGLLSAAALLTAAFGLAVRPSRSSSHDLPDATQPTPFDRFCSWLGGSQPEPEPMIMGEVAVTGKVAVTVPKTGSKP